MKITKQARREAKQLFRLCLINGLIEEARAIAEAQRIISKAKEESAQIYTRSLTDLKREIGHLVINTTGKVAGKILTPADQQKLAEETAKQIAA